MSNDLGLDDSDLYRMVVMDLAAHLPEYEVRMSSYFDTILSDSPSILFVQGVKKDSKDLVIRTLKSNGYLIHWSDRETSYSFGNLTAISNDLNVLDSDEIMMDSRSRNGDVVNVAPDCLVDILDIGGRKVYLLNFESARGSFFEAHRVAMASLIIEYCFHWKREADHEHRPLLMYMAGDLHADPDSQSVRMLCGKQVVQGVPPSAWNDVWAVLKSDASTEDGVTERQREVFSPEVRLPSLVQPRRHTYFMTYDDVFGKNGTPISIALNGNDSTSEGIPFSDDYGLTMDVWIPPTDQYINDDENEEDTDNEQ